MENHLKTDQSFSVLSYRQDQWNHLNVQTDVWNDPHQWYQRHEHFELHVSSLVARSIDYIQYRRQKRLTKNQRFTAVVGLLHFGKPPAKRPIFRWSPLTFSQLIPLIWIETGILYGVSPVIWNWNFARDSPTELHFSLWPTQFLANPNQSINVSEGCHWIRLPLDKLWSDYILYPCFSSWNFRTFRVSSPKPIWVIIIVEYSTISMLNYFEDTLDNVGLPEAWLGRESNYLTQIVKKCIKSE